MTRTEDSPKAVIDALPAEAALSALLTSHIAAAKAVPGFFPMSSGEIELEDPLAQEFLSWREQCESTIRSTYQILSRGTPNLENETWNAAANVIRGTETPEDPAQRLQDGLASWYAPQQQ